MNRDKQSVNLKEEILRLISQQQEGGYWDFKKQWHENNSSLLHDIICMSNNLYNRDSYIIIGIDEEQEYETVDVCNDPHRKNTQNIVDFLKDKKFAGGMRPVVYVEQISLHGKTIDVIVIRNSCNTPFYLSESYQGIYANHIYTRVMDTNTPKTQSADINNIEYLWRKRFHMDEPPIDKMRYYLTHTENWEDSPVEDLCKYYKFSPEYTIKEEFDERRTGYKFYMFGQMDYQPSWSTITLYYHQTALKQFLGVTLDGGKCFVVAPSWLYISFDGYLCSDISFWYYDKSSFDYTVQKFYHYQQNDNDDYGYALRRFMECILLFDSDIERNEFEQYVSDNESLYKELYAEQGDSGLPIFPNLKGYDMDEFKKDYRNALVFKRMLEKFRGHYLD